MWFSGVGLTAFVVSTVPTMAKQTQTTDEWESATKTWVATTRDGWGRAFAEDEAIANALLHTDPSNYGRFDDMVDVWAYRVAGFKDIWPGDDGITAGKVFKERHYRVPSDDVEAFREKHLGRDLDIESLVVGNEVEAEAE